MIPRVQADDVQTSYADFDSQRIERFPIIKRINQGDAVGELEVQGPTKKRPEVNADNTQLFTSLEM